MRILLILCVIVASVAGAGAQQQPAPKVAFEKYTLANGIQVILHVDRKLPVVHVNQWFHVGSKNERVGRTGFAHLFEHMMFQGSKNADKYFVYVERAGANLQEGGVNGTTDYDRTNYFATVPSANLETLLWLESDRLATLVEGIDQKKLDNQRDVVKNERRQGLENVPYGRWEMVLSENMFPARHPYSHDVIGTHEDLTAASMEDVKDFFRTWYAPNNLSLVVAGDFDPALAKKLIEKYFGSIPPGPPVERPERVPAHLDGERILEVSDHVPQERVYLAWHTPAFYDPGDGELDLVSSILSDGLSARLNKALVYDQQLCSDTVAFQMSREISSSFVIWATVRQGIPITQVEKILTDEIARLAKTGPTQAELDRAKTKWEYGFVTGLERIGGFGGKADRLNSYNTFLGDPGKFDFDVARHREATIESTRQVVDRYLNTRNRIVLRFRPETAARDLSASVDRTKQPPLGADRPFETPDVKSAKLANGMDIFVVERHDLPKVAVQLGTLAGSIFNPPGKEGLADLAVTVMSRGTKTRSALQISDAMGDLGANIFGGAGLEAAGTGFEVLKRNLTPALAVFADVVQHPVFPQAELDREKKIRLDQLSQDDTDANAIAARVGPMLAFGRDHAYGRPTAGLGSTIGGLTRDDFTAFYESYWKAGGSALVFSGDITLEEAVKLAEADFGKWTGNAPKRPEIGPARPPGAGKVYIIDRPDAAQTVVSQVLPGVRRKSDDYYAIRLADAVWGGGFGTRLNLNLREEKGFSYGVFSFPRFYSQGGVWTSMGGVQTDKTKESVAEFEKELRNLGGGSPITAKELEYAKANRMRGYAQQFESLGRMAGQVVELWSAGLPMTELKREVAEIDKATLDQANAAARKYAVPANTTLLLVGDRSKIEKGIRELNPGEIVFLNVEGKPAK